MNLTLWIKWAFFLYILKVNMRNKGFRSLHVCIWFHEFIFFNSFVIHFSSLRLECSRKRTELTVGSLKFWLWFHHIMAMIILAKFEWPKGRGLVLFIWVFPAPQHMLNLKHSWTEHITKLSHLLKRENVIADLILAHTIKHDV